MEHLIASDDPDGLIIDFPRLDDRTAVTLRVFVSPLSSDCRENASIF
jgi:hypothetical protein